MRTHRHTRGFTLIEVMVSIGILSMMLVVAWASVIATINAGKHYTALSARNREARSALTRIAHDLEMAYISTNEDRTQQDTRTFFVGEASGEVTAVRFSAFAHTKLYADANESDQTVIAYYAAPDPKDRSKTDLMRRESRRMAGPSGTEKWDALPGEAEAVFTSISKLKLSYWDAINQEWKDSWSTQSADQGGLRVPDRVKVTMTYRDANDKEVTLTTQARIYLQEALQFYAN